MRWMVVGRLFLAICISAVLAAQVGNAWADTERVMLNIPYRSQFDGSYYEGANCGPATMGMILEGFGQHVSTAELRRLANTLAGSDAWDGVYINNLAAMPERYGMQAMGLFDDGAYRKWTAEDVRVHLRLGHVVVPEVRYRYLPGHEGANTWDDHYIVIFGLIDDGFVYHDSASRDGSGANRTISESQLLTAMGRSDFPYAAFAVVPPPLPPPPPPPPSLAPALSAPGHGEPVETPVVSPAPQLVEEKPKGSQDQELSAASTNAQSSLALQIALTLVGLLSLLIIGVTVSRRW